MKKTNSDLAADNAQVVTGTSVPERDKSQAKGDRTRRAIVGAARARFAASGFDGSTMSDVAIDAGVSGPTVVFHFGSKLGLLTAVIEDYFDGLIARIEAIVDAPNSPAERLVAFARAWMREHDGGFDLYSVFASQGGWRAIETESGKALRENSRRVSRVFERLVEDLKADGTIRMDVSTRLVRDAFFGTAEHLQRGRIRWRRPMDSNQLADEILSLVLHGAGSNVPRGAVEGSTEARLTAVEQEIRQLRALLQPPGTGDIRPSGP